AQFQIGQMVEDLHRGEMLAPSAGRLANARIERQQLERLADVGWEKAKTDIATSYTETMSSLQRASLVGLIERGKSAKDVEHIAATNWGLPVITASGIVKRAGGIHWYDNPFTVAYRVVTHEDTKEEKEAEKNKINEWLKEQGLPPLGPATPTGIYGSIPRGAKGNLVSMGEELTLAGMSEAQRKAAGRTGNWAADLNRPRRFD
ncbi:MAG: hypothetical protein KGL95_07810, partial [Patescibacteria group bacterium]|nr:hypothetical protein [Patescibacteria group bacterium]